MKFSLLIAAIAFTVLTACSSASSNSKTSTNITPPKFSKPSYEEVKAQRKIADKKKDSAEQKYY